MPSAPAFELTAELLIAATGIDALAVRGTVRLALKSAGLDPAGITPAQMGVVLRSVLPAELTRRGVADAEAICSRIGERLARAGLAGGADVTDRAAAIFERLGSR